MGDDRTKKALAAGRAFADSSKNPKAKAATMRVAAPAPTTKVYARLAAHEPALVARAQRQGPPPTMFHSGHTPPFLASGADPAILNRLPEQIRHYAAKASAAEFGRLVAEYADKPNADLELRMFEPDACSDPGWSDYLNRLASWAGVTELP